MQINTQLSSMVIAGLPAGEKAALLHSTGFQEGSLPFKYLGVPITSGRLSTSDCLLLVQKIIAKILVWKSLNLSYAGRVVLINSVFLGVFGFWASSFILPTEVIKKVEAACRNFLWAGGGNLLVKTPG